MGVQMASGDDRFSGLSAAPGLARGADTGGHGAAPVDLLIAAEITGWRKAAREALIARRLAVPADARKRVATEVATELNRLIDFGPKTVVSLYWPFRGELDLRDWMRAAFAKGARVALPVVVAKAQPLIFREWTPEGRLERGVWNIPVPADGARLTPTVVISPLVGYDPGCYRLGYGGGFFDRTLAALSPRPRVIGVGHPMAAIPTIYPQPHDIPMDIIVTGAGQVLERGG